MILKLSHCENPYEVIANYISNHSEVIEDMIAVLEIDGVRTNELLEYDFDNGSFYFLSDWWEGEQEITLIDYFPVSEACNPKNAIPIKLIVDANVAHALVEQLLCWKEEQEKQK